MALPYIQSNDPQLNLLQTAWKAQLDQVLSNPLNNGLILTNISLLSAGPNVINHKLGQTIQGWFVISPQAPAMISQDVSQPNPNRTIVLNTSADVITNIYVF